MLSDYLNSIVPSSIDVPNNSGCHRALLVSDLVIAISFDHVEMPMKLFHRTTPEIATSILKDGFRDKTDPAGTNLGFYNQIPEIKAVWFSDIPLENAEGKLLLLEMPDELALQLDTTVRMGLWGRSSLPHFSRYKSNFTENSDSNDRVSKIEEGNFYTEYLIPAEMANQYGPPVDITNSEEEYLPNRGLF